MASRSDFESGLNSAGATMGLPVGLTPGFEGTTGLLNPVALLTELVNKGIRGEGASLVMCAYYDCMRAQLERDALAARSEVVSEGSNSSLSSELTSASRSARRRARRRQSRDELDSLVDNQGYCYLRIVKRDSRSAVARRLGGEPTVRDLCVSLSPDDIDWGVFDSVRLGMVSESLGGSVYHAHEGTDGPSFGDLWRSCASRFPTIGVVFGPPLLVSASGPDPAVGVSLIDRVGSSSPLTGGLDRMVGRTGYPVTLDVRPAAVVVLGTSLPVVNPLLEGARSVYPGSNAQRVAPGVVRAVSDEGGTLDIELHGRGYSIGPLRVTSAGRMRVLSAATCDVDVSSVGVSVEVSYSAVPQVEFPSYSVVFLPNALGMNHEPARNFFSPATAPDGAFCFIDVGVTGYLGMFYNSPVEITGAYVGGTPVDLEICGLFVVRPTRDKPFVAFGSVSYRALGGGTGTRLGLELRRWPRSPRSDLAKFGDRLCRHTAARDGKNLRHAVSTWDRGKLGDKEDPLVVSFSR